MRRLLNSILTTGFLFFALFMIGNLSANATERTEVKSTSKVFTFNGQNEEILDLTSETIVYRQVPESFPSTCTRTVPYDEQVCHNETQMREVNCRWEPPRESCNSVPRQVCDTRYEQQCGYRNEQVCNQVPRQVCHQQPVPVCHSVTRYRQECRRLPGPPTCQIINGRRICQPGPGQQVCQNVPYQEQVCRTDYRQVCNTQYENVCRYEQRHYCETVPRNVCRTEYDRQCTTIPGERVCDRVPQTVPVCHTERRTREETYACTETRMVERAEVAKHHRARVIFNFVEEARSQSDIRVTATLAGDDLKLVADASSNVIVWAQKSFEFDGEEQLIRVTLRIVNRGPLAAPFMFNLENLRHENRELLFTSGRIVDPNLVAFRLEIRHEGKHLFDRVLASNEFELREVEGSPAKSLVVIKPGQLGVKLSGLFKKYQVRITLVSRLSGESINTPEINWIKVIEQEL